jgi:CheY-like chemotaxis protein
MPSTLYTNILLVEDDDDDYLFFQDALVEITKYVHLTRAENGGILMKLLATHSIPLPDIVFLDLNMPGKDGFECLVEIRQSDKLKELPIIIFSTSDEPSDVRKAYQEGANFYLTKPANFNTLKLNIEQILSCDWKENVSLDDTSLYLSHVS